MRTGLYDLAVIGAGQGGLGTRKFQTHPALVRTHHGGSGCCHVGLRDLVTHSRDSLNRELPGRY